LLVTPGACPRRKHLKGAPIGLALVFFVTNVKTKQARVGSEKAKEREPNTFLGRVFNYRLGCFDDVHVFYLFVCIPISIVEDSA
jgi:hypothetical protein